MQITEVKVNGKWIPSENLPKDALIQDLKALATPDEIEKLSHISLIKSIKLAKEKKKRSVYLILNPSHSPCQILYASLSIQKRDNVYDELQNCVDLECAEIPIDEIHADLVEEY